MVEVWTWHSGWVMGRGVEVVGDLGGWVGVRGSEWSEREWNMG